MSGKDKVVHGAANKAQVAMAHLLPDAAVTGATRSDMEDRNEAHAQAENTQKVVLGVGIAALAVAGLVLLSAWNSRNPVERTYDKARFRFRANRLKNSAVSKAQSGLEDLKDTVMNAVK